MTAVRVGDSETFARVCGDSNGLLVQPSAGKSTKESAAISSVDQNETELKASASVDEKGKRPTTIPSNGERSVAGRKASSKKLSEKKYTSLKSPEETKFVVTMASERRKRPGLKSSAAAVFYMFCDHCDNEVLSRDEKAFSEQILSQTYSDALPGLECLEHRLEYDSSLYRFCAGLVLRALAIQRGVSKCTNSARIYHLFKQCRALLSEPDGCGVNKGDIPQIAMFFTPVREPMFAAAESSQHKLGERRLDDAGVEHSSVPLQHDKPKSISLGNDAKDLQSSMSTSEKPSQPSCDPLTSNPTGNIETAEPILRHFFESNTFSKLSHTPLLNSVPDVVRRGHFLVVHCGIFSIVLLIEPVVSLPAKYSQFLIHPEGGCLHVPVNDHRMSLLPLGMTMLYQESVARAAKNMLEMAKQVGPANAVFNRVRHIRIDEVTESDAGLIQALEEGAAYQPCCVSYLPAQYSVDFRTNRVLLPPCDRVLLHTRLQPDEETGSGLTVLLAVHEDHVGKTKPKPYAIVCHFSQHSNLCLGFYLDTSGEKYAFESFLHEPYSKMILEELHPKQDAKSPQEAKMDGCSRQESKEKMDHFLLNIPSILLPQALSDAGVSTFESLLFHSPRGGPSLDRKCGLGEGCWYCWHCCDICTNPFVPGFLMRREPEDAAPVDLRFCSQDCYSVGQHWFTSLTRSELKMEASGVHASDQECGKVTAAKGPIVTPDDAEKMIHHFSAHKNSEEDQCRHAIVAEASCFYQHLSGVWSMVSITFRRSTVAATSSQEPTNVGLFLVRSSHGQVVGELKAVGQQEVACFREGSTFGDEPVITAVIGRMVAKCLEQFGASSLQELVESCTAKMLNKRTTCTTLFD